MNRCDECGLDEVEECVCSIMRRALACDACAKRVDMGEGRLLPSSGRRLCIPCAVKEAGTPPLRTLAQFARLVAVVGTAEAVCVSCEGANGVVEVQGVPTDEPLHDVAVLVFEAAAAFTGGPMTGSTTWVGRLVGELVEVAEVEAL